jgi:hypothetical protein
MFCPSSYLPRLPGTRYSRVALIRSDSVLPWHISPGRPWPSRRLRTPNELDKSSSATSFVRLRRRSHDVTLSCLLIRAGPFPSNTDAQTPSDSYATPRQAYFTFVVALRSFPSPHSKQIWQYLDESPGRALNAHYNPGAPFVKNFWREASQSSQRVNSIYCGLIPFRHVCGMYELKPFFGK